MTTQFIVAGAKPPLAHCWSAINKLSVFTSVNSRSAAAGSRSKLGHEPPLTVDELTWSASMTSDEFMRRLAKSSYGIFANLQSSTGEKDQFVAYSKQYRAALAVCEQEICQFLKRDDIDEARALHLTAECETVQAIELVWHLAELIFIQPSASNYLAYNLCCWFHIQSPPSALRDLTASSSSSQPELDERYWPTLVELVLQAQPRAASGLLSLHSHANCRQLKTLRRLLASMPVVGDACQGHAFTKAWTFWQIECKQKLTSGELGEPALDPLGQKCIQLILSVLSGKSEPAVWTDDLLVDVSGGPRCWYFRFVAYLFYTRQPLEAADLSRALDSWFQLIGGRPSGGELTSESLDIDDVVDSLIESVFRFNIRAFLTTSSSRLESWWLVAHFSNLLQHSCPVASVLTTNTTSSASLDQFGFEMKPKIEQNLGVNSFSDASLTNASILNSDTSQHSSSNTLSDFFLIGYAESLANDPGMLPIALGYLSHCQSQTERQSRLLLGANLDQSTRTVNRLISLAKRHRLGSVVEAELAALACRRLSNLASYHHSFSGDYYSLCLPLGWACRSGHSSIIARLADLALSSRNSSSAMSLQDSDRLSLEMAELAVVIMAFVNSTGSGGSLQLTPELTFLVRYAEMQQNLASSSSSGDHQAVDQLLALLDHQAPVGVGRIPARLKLRLLAQVRSLLPTPSSEDDVVLMRRDQIEALIQALIELRSEIGDEQEESSQLYATHAFLANQLALVTINGGSSVY